MNRAYRSIKLNGETILVFRGNSLEKVDLNFPSVFSNMIDTRLTILKLAKHKIKRDIWGEIFTYGIGKESVQELLFST